MKKIFNLFDLKQKVNYKNEVLSGLTVALALVPEAIAFALIAGLSPLTGLYAAFSIGLITSIFGGRPGMISGATGAIAVIYVGMIAIIKKTNPDISVEEITQYIFATVILAGLIQIGVGLLRLGKFIRLVPHPVMFGFVNGLAIVIFLAQMSSFKENRKDHYGNNAVEAISTNQAFHVNGSVVTSDKTNTIQLSTTSSRANCLISRQISTNCKLWVTRFLMLKKNKWYTITKTTPFTISRKKQKCSIGCREINWF